MSKSYRYLQQAIDTLTADEWYDPSEMQPCTAEEIVLLQTLLPEGYLLPKSLVEFLEYCGHGLLYTYWIEYFFYEFIRWDLESRGSTGSRISYAQGIDFPEDAVLLGMQYLCEFFYVRLSEGEDPPVYFLSKEEGPLSEAPHFSDWIEGHFAVTASVQRAKVAGRSQLQALVNAFKPKFFSYVSRLEALGQSYNCSEEFPLSSMLRDCHDLRRHFYERIYTEIAKGGWAADLNHRIHLQALPFPEPILQSLAAEMESLENEWDTVVAASKESSSPA